MKAVPPASSFALSDGIYECVLDVIHEAANRDGSLHRHAVAVLVAEAVYISFNGKVSIRDGQDCDQVIDDRLRVGKVVKVGDRARLGWPN